MSSIFIPSADNKDSYTKDESNRRFERRSNDIVKAPGTFWGDYVYFDDTEDKYVSGSSKITLGKNQGKNSSGLNGVFLGNQGNDLTGLDSVGDNVINIGSTNSPLQATNSIVLGNNNSIFAEQKEDSIIIGRNCCQGGSGLRSIAIGQNICAPINKTMGTQVTALGYNISNLTGVGSHSLLLGSNAGVMSTTADIPSEIICLNALASPSAVNRQSGSCYIQPIRQVTFGNTLTYNTNGELGYQVSSVKYKTNIREFDSTEGIYELSPKIYDYKAREGHQLEPSQRNQISFIAEDVYTHLPGCTYLNENNEVENYSDRALITCLVAELKKLKTRIDVLEANQSALADEVLPQNSPELVRS